MSKENKLSSKTREEIQDYLVDVLMDGMWGDGQEDEYVRHGIDFKGVMNYTDKELVEAIDGLSDEEELKVRAKAERNKTEIDMTAIPADLLEELGLN